MPDDEPDAVTMEAAVHRLQLKAERLARECADRVFGELPTYTHVPRNAVETSALRHVHRALAALLQRQAPGADSVDEGDLARERARQGVRVEEVLRGYRICLKVIRDEFVRQAAYVGLGTDKVAQGVQVLWDVSDVVTVQLAVAHREITIQQASRAEEQRLDFLRSVLHGTISLDGVSVQSAEYGMAPDRLYYAVRARPIGSTSTSELRQALECLPSEHRGCSAFVGVLDGDVAGLVTTVPSLGTLTAIVGVGAPRILESSVDSFRTASRLLTSAERLGLTGTFELGDLSWRVAVASEPELGELLIEKYLAPLHRQSAQFGALLEETLQAYLSADGKLRSVADGIHIHENTLRYRLRRFEMITGYSLASSRVAFEVLWALEARAGAMGRSRDP